MSLKNLWLAEPAAIAAAIRASILLGVAFGLGWSPEQIAAIMLAVETVLALLTRQSVVTQKTAAAMVAEASSTGNG